ELPPEVAARGYYHQPVWKRIVVIGAGPAVNIAIALAILFFIFLNYGRLETTQNVGKIEPGSPAAAILESGDELVAVDGSHYANLDQTARLEKFAEVIASHKCAGKQVDGCQAKTPVTLTIRREGQLKTISVTPTYDKTLQRTRIGFQYHTDHIEF